MLSGVSFELAFRQAIMPEHRDKANLRHHRGYAIRAGARDGADLDLTILNYRRLLDRHQVIVTSATGRSNDEDKSRPAIRIYRSNKKNGKNRLIEHNIPAHAIPHEPLTLKFLTACLLLERSDGTALWYPCGDANITSPYANLASRPRLHEPWKDQRDQIVPLV